MAAEIGYQAQAGQVTAGQADAGTSAHKPVSRQDRAAGKAGSGAVSTFREQVLITLARRCVIAPSVDVLLQDAAKLLAEALGMEHYLGAEFSEKERKIYELFVYHPMGAVRPSITTDQRKPDPRTSLAAYAMECESVKAVEKLDDLQQVRDPLFADRSIISALLMPLRISGKPLGAIVLASSRERRIEKLDLLYAEAAQHLISTAVWRLLLEAELALERRLRQRILQVVQSVVLTLDEQGQVISINECGEHLTGFSREEIAGQPFVEVFAVEEEKRLWNEVLDQLRKGRSHVEHHYQLIGKDCRRFAMNWNCTALRNPDGTVGQFVLSGQIVLGAEDEEQFDLQDEQQQADESDNSPARTPTRRRKSVKRFILASERRKRPRRAYPYLQLVAPIQNGVLPDPKEFIEVECNDISPGGFSFYYPTPFPSDSLVVALGAGKKLTYLTAEVAHVTRTERDGETVYLIGCSYTGRVKY